MGKKELSDNFLSFIKTKQLDRSDENAYIVGVNNFQPVRLKFIVGEKNKVMDITGNFKPLSDTFFELIYEEYLKNSEYFLSEVQYPSDVTHSGLMIDLDCYSPANSTSISALVLIKLLTIIKDKLKEVFKISNFKTYAFVLRKKTLKKSDKYDKGSSEEKIPLYKDGLHLVLPKVKLTKNDKTYFLNSIKDKINEVLINIGYSATYPPYDTNSCFVNVYLFGTTKNNEEHFITEIFEIDFNSSKLDKVNEDFYIKEILKDKVVYKFNMCKELSIHYSGEMMESIDLEIKDDITTNIIEFVSPIVAKLSQNEMTKITKSVEEIIAYDPKAQELVYFLDILDKRRGKRSNSCVNSEWAVICKNIITINEKYLDIAIWFSLKHDSSNWEENGAKALNVIYKDILTEKCVTLEMKNYAFNLIKSFARNDNEQAFKEADAKTLNGKIRAALSSFGTDVLPNDIAKIVASVYSGRFYFIRNKGISSKGDGYWLFYITEEYSRKNRMYAPFIYKYYKSYHTPKELDYFISEEISEEIKKIVKQMNYKEEEISKEEKAKMNRKRTKMDNMTTRLGVSSGIKDVISRLREQHLLCEDVLFEIDNKDVSTLGVGNGLLIFNDKNFDFIKEGSVYKITRTTRTFYKKYDQENPITKKLEEILSDIFENPLEKKAILMSLSECFVRHQSQRFMHFWISNGSSGKSFICKLLHNVLGIKGDSRYGESYGYSYSVSPDIFMSDKKDPNGADPHLVNLEGMMIVTANEAKKGDIKSETFKRLKDNNPARKLFGENSVIDFPGIVVVSSNQEPNFTSYDYGFERRILYYIFKCVFVYKEDYEKKIKLNDGVKYKIRDDSLMKLAEFDKEYAESFLSILLEHWLELKNKYNGNIDVILEESGIMKETKEFIARHDHLNEFILKFVKNDEKSVVSLSDFAQAYSEFLSKKFKNNTKAHDYLGEIQCNSTLSNKLRRTEQGTFFAGIKLEI